MASETLTTLAEQLKNAVAPTFQEAFARPADPNTLGDINSLFQLVRSRGLINFGQYDMTGAGGGDMAGRWLVKSATGNTYSSFDSGEARPAGGTVTDALAVMAWKRIWATESMRGDAYRASQGSAMWNGQSAWVTKTLDLFKDALDKIDTMIVGDGSGNSSKDWDGLDNALGSDTNSYAGINRTTAANAYFRPFEVAGGSVDITKALLDSVHSTLVDTRAVNYDVLLCSETQAEKLENLLDARRTNPSDIAPGMPTYRGRPIVALRGCQNDVIYFAKMDNFRLQIQPWLPGPLDGALAQGANINGLPVGLMVNDDNSDGASLTMGIEGNFFYLNPWESGWISALAT